MHSLKTIETSKATVLWRYLNGVINVYKPAGVGINQLFASLRANLCKGNQTVFNSPKHQKQKSVLTQCVSINRSKLARCETDPFNGGDQSQPRRAQQI